MIRKLSNLPIKKFLQLNIQPFTAGLKNNLIRDSDSLTTEELEDVLGIPIEKHPQPQSSAIKSPETDLVEKDRGFYYGLMPKFNEDYPECIDPDLIIIQETPNQNIFAALALPENCSFQDYTSALSKFRTEIDLYGDEEEKSIILNDSLEFKELLCPESKYLERARNRFMVNISMPGTIQCEDPRNFMELRPIEQFRHTPLVPISESAMQQHKQMLQRYHRKQFIFQVSKQSILNWTLVAGVVGVASYFIYLILQKEEERTVAFSRLKYQRVMGQNTETPVFRI